MSDLKDSGSYWLGEIPEDWEMLPAWALFTEGKEKCGADDPHLVPSRVYGVVTRDDLTELSGNKPVDNEASAHNMKHVNPHDFIISMGSHESGIEHSRLVGKVSNDYRVLRPTNDVNPEYYKWFFKSDPLIEGLRGLTTEIRVGQRIHYSRFSLLRLPIPSAADQQRIADYLDRETAEIDAAVADLDRYVQLLEKRRRRVVIQGFNDPKYNPVSQRLKFLTVSEDHRRIPIKSGDRVDMAGEFPYYGASGVIDYVNDYLWDNEKRLLLSEDGANLVMRNHPVAFVADGQYWVNNHAHVLKCRGETPPELVAKAIEVTSIAHLITGSAQPKLTAAAMGEIEFLFPLSVSDQKALLADLQPEMEEIDALIEESTKLRDLLLKRRSVLITEVVTGRKQV